MVATESVGWAMKKLSIETDEPGVGPADQVGPAEPCWTAGTKTLYLAAASR